MEPVDYTKLDWRERKRVRLAYIDAQDGKCAHCGSSLDGNASGKIMSMKINKRIFPKSFFENPVHLHHDHNTGMTIGAVHNQCNAVLWQYYGK